MIINKDELLKQDFFKYISCVNYSFEDCFDSFGIIIFLKGCNLRCNYCYNIDIAKGKQIMNTDEILEYFNRDLSFVDCIILCGGEPLIHDIKVIKNIISFFKKYNQNIIFKIDTNGLFPEKVEYLIKNGLVKRFSIDIKRFPLSKYLEILPNNYNNKEWEEKIRTNILKTIAVIKDNIDKIDKVEFRTVKLDCISDEEIKEIKKFLTNIFKNTLDFNKKIEYNVNKLIREVKI